MRLSKPARRPTASQPTAPGASQRELDRLTAFSDGVFSIAITLLVLGIAVPQVEQGSLPDALNELVPDITAYFIGFAVIGLFWYGHHRLFAELERSNGALVVVNLLFLSMIALMPFTTGVLGGYDGESIAVAVYAVNLGLAATLDSILDRVAARGKLFLPGVEPEHDRLVIEGIMRPVVFLSSIPVAFVSPVLAQLWWLLLFPTPRIAERIAARRRRRQSLSAQ